MKPEDVLVWERFLNQHPDFFDRVDYDFCVGEGVDVPDGTPENIARDAKILSQKKIDVVGYKDDDVWIVELKPTADKSALGQIQVYEHLFDKQERVSGDILSVVIAGEVEREVSEIFGMNGVEIILV